MGTLEAVGKDFVLNLTWLNVCVPYKHKILMVLMLSSRPSKFNPSNF